jgi:exosome complex component RRP42
MATVLISEAEKTYVLHGVQEDVRVDGRGRKDVRPIVFESGLVKMIENIFTIISY